MSESPLMAHTGLQYYRRLPQYSDTAYVTALLSVLVPMSVVSLFSTFTGNAKQYRYLFVATQSTVCCYLYTLTWICNLDISARLILLISSFFSAYHTDVFAWHAVSLWQILVIYATLFQLIASFTPFHLGILIILPGYLTATIYVQFIVQMVFFTILSCLTYILINCVGLSNAKDMPNVWYNGLSSILGAYFVTSGISYIVLITGLSLSTYFDPVGLFSTPSPLSLSNMTLTALLLLWICFGYIGWKAQMHRDSYLQQQKRVAIHESDRHYSDNEETASLLYKEDTEEA